MIYTVLNKKAFKASHKRRKLEATALGSVAE